MIKQNMNKKMKNILCYSQKLLFEQYLKEYYNLVDECTNKGINWNELFYMFCICKGYINSKKESHELIDWIDDNNIEIYE